MDEIYETEANFYLDQAQVDELIGQGAWKVKALPLDKAAQIRKHFGNEMPSLFF